MDKQRRQIMNRILLAVGCLMAGILPVRADYQKGNSSLQFGFGPVGYSHEVKVNNGENTLDNCGGAGGLQYLYFLGGNPAIAIGPDILWSDLSEEDASGILPNSRSHG